MSRPDETSDNHGESDNDMEIMWTTTTSRTAPAWENEQAAAKKPVKSAAKRATSNMTSRIRKVLAAPKKRRRPANTTTRSAAASTQESAAGETAATALRAAAEPTSAAPEKEAPTSTDAEHEAGAAAVAPPTDRLPRPRGEPTEQAEQEKRQAQQEKRQAHGKDQAEAAPKATATHHHTTLPFFKPTTPPYNPASPVCVPTPLASFRHSAPSSRATSPSCGPTFSAPPATPASSELATRQPPPHEDGAERERVEKQRAAPATANDNEETAGAETSATAASIVDEATLTMRSDVHRTTPERQHPNDSINEQGKAVGGVNERRNNDEDRVDSAEEQEDSADEEEEDGPRPRPPTTAAAQAAARLAWSGSIDGAIAAWDLRRPVGRVATVERTVKECLRMLCERHRGQPRLRVGPHARLRWAWTTQMQSELVGTVLQLHNAVPPLYTSRVDDGLELIVDGRHVLHTLLRYSEGAFPWTAPNGARLRFCDLSAEMRACFLGYKLEFRVLHGWSDQDTRTLYLRLNQVGGRHVRVRWI